MNVFELKPKNGRNSFYGKALVYQLDDGTEIMRSYNTNIVLKEPDGTLYRLVDDPCVISNTTACHINSFCGLNKAKYMKLPFQVGDDNYWQYCYPGLEFRVDLRWEGWQ